MWIKAVDSDIDIDLNTLAQELVGRLGTADLLAQPLVFRQFVFSRLDTERAPVDQQVQQPGAVLVRADQQVQQLDAVRVHVEFLSLLVLL